MPLLRAFLSRRATRSRGHWTHVILMFVLVSSNGRLLSSLANAWLADGRGQVLIASWAATVVGVTLRAVLQRKKKKKQAAEEEPKAKVAESPPPVAEAKATASLAHAAAAASGEGRIRSAARRTISRPKFYKVETIGG